MGAIHVSAEVEDLRSLIVPEKRRRKTERPPEPIHWLGSQRIFMCEAVYQDIVRVLGSRPPEAGGILLGPSNSTCVTHFHYDFTGQGTGASFTFDHLRLNEVLKQFMACGMDCKGVVHSHPNNYCHPSPGDLIYARKAFSNPKNNVAQYLMPLVVDGHLYPFVILQENPDVAVPATIVLF